MTAGGAWDHSTVGPYRLVNRLGEGGMGVVHLAVGPDERAVAIKVLKGHISADPDARRRLAREVETLRRVRHPRVAEVLDADVDGPVPYVVTRFVPGRTLEDLVRERGPMPLERVVHTGRLLAEALRSIHASGVVHRDVKPANVMLVDDAPVLIDFGIAHVGDESRITVTGLVMGTPGYLSPEVVGGHPVTPATDWWGWGGTLAFAATGRPPFGTGPIEVVLDRVRRGDADLAGLDDRLRSVVATALVADPDRRPPADWLVGALDAVLSRRSSPSAPTVPTTAGGAAAGGGTAAGGGAAAKGASLNGSAARGATAAGLVHARSEAPSGPGRPASTDPGALAAAPTVVTPPPAAPTVVTPPPAAPTVVTPPPAAPTMHPSQHHAPTVRTPAPGGGAPDPVQHNAPTVRTPPPAAPTAPHRPMPTLVDRPAMPAASTPAPAQHPAVQSSGQPAMPPSAPSLGRPGVPPSLPAVLPPTGLPAPQAALARPSAQPVVHRPAQPPVHQPQPPAHQPVVHQPVVHQPQVHQPQPPVARPDAPPLPDADQPPLERPTTLLLAGLVALAAMATVAPGGAVVVLLLWMVVARTADRSALGIWRRRYAYGPRTSDIAVTVLATPWRLLVAVVMSLLAIVLPLLVAASVAFIVGTARGGQTQFSAPTEPVGLACAAVGAVLVAWWGPGGASVRRGTNWLGRLAIRRRTLRIGLLVFLGFVVLAALITLGNGVQPDFAPFRAATSFG